MGSIYASGLENMRKKLDKIRKSNYIIHNIFDIACHIYT